MTAGTPQARPGHDYPLTDISEPGTFGAEWGREDVSRFRLFNPCGTRQLWLSYTMPGRGWQEPRPVSDPGRFGMHRAPRSWREFARIVDAYITAD